MASITAGGISPNVQEYQQTEEPVSQSFYGRRFKALRVTGDALYSILLSIFYKSLSVACWIFRQKAAHHRYGDKASYHFNRILQRPLVYLSYGDKVVNFAINSTGTPRRSKENSGVEGLKSVYGDQFEKMFSRASSEDMPILEEKLSHYPINEGICLGASLDFIARYLRDESETSFESIEKISQLFSAKGTPEAQITQILYKAQDISSLLQRKSEHREKLEIELNENIEKIKIEMNKWQESVKAKMKDLQGPELKKIIAEEMPRAEFDFLQKLKEIKSEIHREIAENNSELDCQRFQGLAIANDLQLNLNTVFIDEDTKHKEIPETFDQRISGLPEGAYLVSLSNSPDCRSGHAIAFIKTSENDTYLFDPNFATLRFEKPDEFIKGLWGLTKKFYNTHGDCTMQIFDCHSRT